MSKFKCQMSNKIAYSAEVASATKAGQNPNVKNNLAFNHLTFIWNLSFVICYLFFVFCVLILL